MNFDKIKEDIEKIKNRAEELQKKIIKEEDNKGNKIIRLRVNYYNFCPTIIDDTKALITYVNYLIRELETYRKNVHI